ncbi:unnamed protein product [Cylindrotheca closterium]|uniref:Uncharacterized protein n=1 Tax=Cylindrotheca closterium TaxID=2856 RepID=A0AAD2CPH4_9STRA|nr:unnamed protein product [Cylindrotheca closterium]
MRGNQIIFSHDSVEKVNHVLVSKEDLDNITKVHFYNEKGRDNVLAWKTYGTSKLYDCSSVLQQLFAVLGRLSPYYSHIRQDTIDNLVEKVEQSVREKKDNPIFISDKQSLLHEKRLGSDVGGVHQVDSMSDNYHDYFGGASTLQIEGSSHPSSNEDLPLKTHDVSPSPDTLLQTESNRKQVESWISVLADTRQATGLSSSKKPIDNFVAHKAIIANQPCQHATHQVVMQRHRT